jgi:hypothetical protein
MGEWSVICMVVVVVIEGREVVVVQGGMGEWSVICMVVVVVIEGRWDGGVVSNLYGGCGGYRGKVGWGSGQ